MITWFIALRYLISKKSVNIINLISVISVLGVAVGTAALIVVLSGLNGMNGLIDGMFSTFDADLKITAREGKNFSPDTVDFEKVFNLEGVGSHSWVIEETALLEYEGRQRTAIVKGVDINYSNFIGLDTMIVRGVFLLKDSLYEYVVFGAGVAYDLAIGRNAQNPVTIHFPKRELRNQIAVQNAFNRRSVYPAGIFSIQQDIDVNYVFVSLDLARSVFEMGDNITSLELNIDKSGSMKQVQKQISGLLGNSFDVKTRYETHEFIYKTMKSEKWVSFLILSFILFIASFNLLGSLTMIMIYKKDDIFVLQSMGASRKLIRRIFLIEGWLISLSGAIIGLVIGIILVVLQDKYELIKLGSEGSFAISSYPVDLLTQDILMVLAVVLLIGFFVAWYPVKSLKIKS